MRRVDSPRTVAQKSVLQAIWDTIGMPFRLALLPQEWLPRLGWTTLEDERINAVLPWIDGRLLDIGSGPNALVRRYGNGVGVDIHDWGGGTVVVEDTANLPFPSASFDTVTFLACLNHIPNREAVLREVRRLVRPQGRVIVTMIDPVLGGIGHAIWWYDERRHRGGAKPGEVGGLWNRDIIRMCGDVDLILTEHNRFVFWMNNLLVFERTRIAS